MYVTVDHLTAEDVLKHGREGDIVLGRVPMLDTIFDDLYREDDHPLRDVFLPEESEDLLRGGQLGILGGIHLRRVSEYRNDDGEITFPIWEAHLIRGSEVVLVWVSEELYDYFGSDGP